MCCARVLAEAEMLRSEKKLLSIASSKILTTLYIGLVHTFVTFIIFKNLIYQEAKIQGRKLMIYALVVICLIFANL